MNEMIALIYQTIHPEVVVSKLTSYQDVSFIFKFHSLEPILYHAYQKGLLEITPEEQKQLEKTYQLAIYKTATQEAEFNNIKESLSLNKIPFLPIKGQWVRSCYPTPEMRTMADLDILVSKSCLIDVKKIMISLGYTFVHEGGNHDVYHKKPFMNVEIHRNMIDESYSLSKYYRNIWERVHHQAYTSECSLSHEDHYLFIVAHSAKHYGAGGTGVRSVLDVYFYWKKFPDMDENYLAQELVKLNLVTYEQNIHALSQGWFEGKPMSEEVELMGEYILGSGVYGTISHSLVSNETLQDETKSLNLRKWNYLWSRAFPTWHKMIQIFPILKKVPVLLPFCYLIRIVKGTFQGKVSRQTSQLRHLKQEDIDQKKTIKEKTGR